jgi:tetratricopeptide (TPR) repeat protein
MRLTSTNSDLPAAEVSTPVPVHPQVPPWLLAVLLALLTAILYWPATKCDFINYDDNDYVTSNVHVQNGLTFENFKWAFVNPVDANWHPLTMMSHMLDCQLYGLEPWGHHLTNVLLHSANTALVFLLLWYLTGATWRSALVAALFGVHPLHVESVAWISERKDVLSACFGLLSLIFYAHFAKPKIEFQKSKNAYYLLSLLFLALGLMSKPMLVTWPFVLLLLDYWPLERFNRAGIWRLLIEKIPFFVLVLASSIVTFVVQNSSAALTSINFLPLEARIENALVSYGRYIIKLFWPANLAIFYPYPRHWPLPQVAVAGVMLIGLTLFAWLNRRRRPFILMGWLWFVGTLFPVIGLVQAGQQSMADRYAYVPSLGIFVIVSWGIYELCRRRQAVMLIASVTALLVFCVVTRQQLGFWTDSETLMRHALATTKNNFIAYNNLGAALDKSGRIDDAINQFQHAVRVDPYFVEAYDNLGMELNKKGSYDDAISQLQKAIKLYPDYPQAYVNLGNALGKKGQLDQAITQYQKAIQLDPELAEACYNLGVIFSKRGQSQEAIGQFQKAIQLNPRYAEAHDMLGIALFITGQADAAISQFQEAIRINPDDPEIHNNLGFALESAGRIDDAISQYQEAIRLKPDYSQARISLARVLKTKIASATTDGSSHGSTGNVKLPQQ